MEAEFEDLEALRDPTCLHVLDVVEIKAGDGEDLEVLDGGGFVPAAAAEGGVFGLEAPGDEGGESAGFFLQTADDFEVVDALVHGFADAEHHGGGGAHSELMGGAMHGDPVVGAALEAGDALADVVVEDLGAAAGDGVKSGIAKTRDGGAEVQVGVLRDGQDFGGAEAVQPDFREALLDAGEEAFEPIDLEVGVDAALHEDAGTAHFEGFGNFFVDLFEVEDVSLAGLGSFEWAVEGAEGAVLGAEVGVVDVAIDDVGDHALGMEPATDGVSLEAKADEVGRCEVVQGLVAGQRHGSILQGSKSREQALGNRH